MNSLPDKKPFRLTLETKFANFCFCVKTPACPAGWRVDPVTLRALCYLCGKPAPMTGIRRCSECDDEFIDFDQKRFKVWPNGQTTEAIVYCPSC